MMDRWVIFPTKLFKLNLPETDLFNAVHFSLIHEQYAFVGLNCFLTHDGVLQVQFTLIH